MSENTKGRLFLEKKDFVAVVDDEGNELPYQVPKHWGADQLAAGVTKKAQKPAKKAAKKAPAKKAASSGSSASSSAGNTPAE